MFSHKLQSNHLKANYLQPDLQNVPPETDDHKARSKQALAYQNHRMLWVGRDLRYHPGPTPTWDRVLREIVEALSLDMFEARLDGAWSNLDLSVVSRRQGEAQKCLLC